MMFAKINDAFRARVYRRADADGSIFYFSAQDFEGLHCEPYIFASSRGHKLVGAFYHYDGASSDRLIVFEHGMGSGHRGYMKEIERLARAGYRVFSYDHTGCMESGGDTTGGFVQSLRDLNDAICALRADARFSSAAISVVGHSWGAFSALNISALHRDITHIVAFSGFLSVEAIMRQYFGGVKWLFGRKIYRAILAEDQEYVPFDARRSLADTASQVLVIHSVDDPVVRCDLHFDRLKKALGAHPRVTFMKTEGKGHNPNYTADAVAYKDAFFTDYQKAVQENALADDEAKCAFIARYDWHRMTAQDEDVWRAVLAHLAQ